MDQEDMIITHSPSNSTSRNLFDRYNHINGKWNMYKDIECSVVCNSKRVV